MTEDSLVEVLTQLKTHRADHAHKEADSLLLMFLEQEGYVKVVEAYKELAREHGMKA